MGLLSGAVSLTRYRVEGTLEEPIMSMIAQALRAHAISEESDRSEKVVGWTSFQTPFQPRFDRSWFNIGSYLVFSLRIDRKVIPPRIFKKEYALETAKRLAQTGRQYLTRDEKNMVKEHVTMSLWERIPSAPEVYDLLWNYEGRELWFFSNLKAANEELETLFSESFGLVLIRLFPFTMGDLAAGLGDGERDQLLKLSPTVFAG